MHSLCISIIFVILLSTCIDALKHRSVRQTGANQCPNPNNNACAFVYCKNSGKCIEDPTTINCFKCQCTPGYTDNACAFVDCENSGKCIEDPTTIDCFKCQCTPGYTGRICETQIPILPIECNPGCQNGGTCIGNSCKCNPGYTGIYCEIIDFCSPNNPCQNGGQCISSSLNFICNCVGTGYTGIICTDIIPIDVCQTNPCQNGGTCYKGGNSFVCACLPGWTGTLCTDYENVVIPTTTTPNVPLCTPNPCLNSGTCYSNNFGFVCACPPGWTGTFCTVNENVVIPTTTTPNCPLNCAPGYCVSSGSTVHPYVCMCGDTMQLTTCN
ncbi:unnamed protein product [Rotaria sp. Silwood1]|nr:unnamed protein product [Rotaria sp. Silwood1]